MNAIRIAIGISMLALCAASWAHETRTLGPENGTQYTVTVGMLNEPVFTELRTGLDLIVRTAAGEEPVEGLENSLRVTITAPTGEVRVLEVRPQYQAPGRYTDGYILTVPGTYLIRLVGFIGALEIDETYPREVADGNDLRFP
jgi:hypothetical protein